MGGVNQANQLRAAFTTHFRQNLKEFWPGVFWCIDMAIINSYKLNLAIFGSKTTKSGKRDTSQHRQYIEDLINLLFCIDSEDFTQKITQKPYSKPQFQPYEAGQKSSTKKNENKAQLETLFENHSQIKIEKSGYCVDCEKNLPKKQNLEENSSNFSFNFNKLNEKKRIQKRGKRTNWFCKECNRYICNKNSCWN